MQPGRQSCVLNTRPNGGKKSQISTVKFRHGAILRESLTISYKKRPVAGHLLRENLNDHAPDSPPCARPLSDSTWGDGPKTGTLEQGLGTPLRPIGPLEAMEARVSGYGGADH